MGSNWSLLHFILCGNRVGRFLFNVASLNYRATMSQAEDGSFKYWQGGCLNYCFWCRPFTTTEDLKPLFWRNSSEKDSFCPLLSSIKI